jgi:ABC-2 type transport system permease protein
MRNMLVLFRRELAGYFATPVAYVFIFFFLVLMGGLTFNLANFYERGQADLQPFFNWHPWVYLFFVPAISMRLWAEERRSGTIELLMTLPVTLAQVVLSKFLAGWVFIGLALVLTFPMVLTVNYLGDPDNGVIAAGYVGSWLMAGAYLAIGSAVSAITRNQVIAFVVSVAICFLMNLAGLPAVTDVVGGVLPPALVEGVASLSFLTHFDAITKGVIDARDLLFYLSVMGCFLVANAIILAYTKAD